jgi:hypothetical protein
LEIKKKETKKPFTRAVQRVLCENTLYVYIPIKMKVITLKNILLSTLLLFASVCFGQNYPNKPVTIIVTYAPGGLGDLLARQLAEQLTTKMKQSFIVEKPKSPITH